MLVQSKEIVFLTMSYVVTGFIILTLLENTLFFKKRNLNIVILNYLIFSLINSTVFTIIDSSFLKLFKNPIIYNEVIVIFLRSLLLPVCILWIFIIFYNSKMGIIVFKKLGLSREHLTESSWDYIFYEISSGTGAYIAITLNDYHTIYGKVGSNSFVSAHMNGSNDIYIEDIYEDGDFKKSKNTGILLFEKDILCIYYKKI